MNRTEDLYEHVLGHKSTIDATYALAKMAIEQGIPGDFVEAGVYAGAQSAAMARAIMYTFTPDGDTNRRLDNTWTRRVHLFDSFHGFPALGEHDKELAAGGWKECDTACSQADVAANMKRWGIPDGLLVWHPGWFQDTIPLVSRLRTVEGIKNGEIAILRVDADLYESTKTVLQHMYPLVSPGGWVVIDDWNLDGCRRAVEELVVPAPVYFRKAY